MDTFFADVWQVDLRTGVDIVHSARYHIEPSLTLTEDSVRVCGDADAAEALVCIALRYSYFDEHNEALLTPKREYWPEVSESVSATSGVELTIDNVLAWPLRQLAPVPPIYGNIGAVNGLVSWLARREGQLHFVGASAQKRSAAATHQTTFAGGGAC